MKRLMALLTALALAWALSACGGAGGGSVPGSTSGTDTDSQAPAPVVSTASAEAAYAEEESAPAEESGQESAQGSRVLVAYFSATGNTREVALALQGILGADLYEIVPQEAYTGDDLNYSDDDCRANREQNDPEARPALAEVPEFSEEYDLVFLGYPIWWGQAPKVMYTFLESWDFGGATIVPFCTSGSSDIGSSAEPLQALAPEANWLEGRRFGAGTPASDLEAWVAELALPQLADAA